MKGQTAIGLVILGVVTITAVIGLVLLFTRGSAQGAAILSNDLQVIGTDTRTPVFLVAGESAGKAIGDCENSLKASRSVNVLNKFNCYALPQADAAGLSDQNVVIGCYSNAVTSNTDEAIMRLQIADSFNRVNSPGVVWSETSIGGQRIAMCILNREVLSAH